MAPKETIHKINKTQRPMMGPNAIKDNDRIGLLKLNQYDFSLLLTTTEDFPLRISLSTTRATFGGGCVRELF